MSDNTGIEGTPPEDNEVIRGLREDVNRLNKAVKTAGKNAVAKVKRVQEASSLMPEGFKGLSDIFETEVDGELTEESAAEWLKGRGFSQSSDDAEAEAAKKAAELEAVTNLGGQINAAGNLTPDNSVDVQLEALKSDNNLKTLPEVTAAIDAILNSQG